MTNGDLMEIFNSGVVKLNILVLIQQPFGVSPRKKNALSPPQKGFLCYSKPFTAGTCSIFVCAPAPRF